MTRKALGPLEAQTLLQAQLPAFEVQGRGTSPEQVPKDQDGQRCKGGTGRRRDPRAERVRPGNPWSAEAIPPRGQASALCGGRPGSALWLTGLGVGEAERML